MINMKKRRIYRLDILRIVAMLGIISLHVLGKGGILSSAQPGSLKYWISWMCEIIAYRSVDIFGLLSGYLGYGKNKINSYRIFELISTVFIYSVAITILFILFKSDAIDGVKGVIKSIFPFLDGRYWYIMCYIPVAIIAPYTNKFMKEMNIDSHRMFCIISIFLFCIIPSITKVDIFRFSEGYSFVWLEILYIIGGYIKRTSDRKVYRQSHMIYLFITVALCILCGNIFIYTILNRNIAYMISYISPLILLMSILSLYIAKGYKCNKIEKCNKFIINFAGVAFDVYIIHSHIYVFDNIINDSFVWILKFSPVLIPFLVLITSLIIYTCLGIIGIIRMKIYKKTRLKIIWNNMLGQKLSYTLD